MSLFGKKAENVAVIDVRSSSIGAGYAVLGAPPTLVYTTRAPLAPNATEPTAEVLPRILDSVLKELVKEGSPLLRKASGRGSVDRVIVTFTAPWQRSHVGSQMLNPGKPFVFNKELVEHAAQAAEEGEGWTRVSQMVIATLLNGYEVESPFGKKVNRAELILLTSSLATDYMELIEKLARKALHQHKVEFNAFMPEAYAVFRDLYPHQRDFLVLDIGGEATDVMLAKHGLLLSMTCMPHGVGEMSRAAHASGVSSPTVPTQDGAVLDLAKNQGFASKMDEAKALWLAEMKASIGELAKQEPLPRTVFLLAEEGVRDFLKNLLDAPDLRSLWLSDESISVLPVLPGQFATFLAEGSVTPPDPALAILTLAAAKHG